MASLSDVGEQVESVEPWNVREVILDSAQIAAVRSGRWEQALAFVDEIVTLKAARASTVLDLARARFNAIDALLGLGRHEEAQTLLAGCLGVFAEDGNTGYLARLFSRRRNWKTSLGTRTEPLLTNRPPSATIT